jgi:hypothetical protein
VAWIWFVPASLALSGIFLAFFNRDYDLARRSAAVLFVSFGLAQGFTRLARQQSTE